MVKSKFRKVCAIKSTLFVKVVKSYVVNNYEDGCAKMYIKKFATSQTLIISFLN